MALKLRWNVDAESWWAVARFLGLTLKAFSDGDWCVVNPHDADSVMLKTAEPCTLTAAQEAAEAAAARLLAEDEEVMALLGLRWIPVAERLPTEGVRVLVACVGAEDEPEVLELRSSLIMDSGFYWADDAGVRGTPLRPGDHWRPIPPGPT